MKKMKTTELIEHINDGFVAFDREMNYTYVNKRGGEMLGRKPEELIGKNYWTEYPEAKGTPFANAYMKALETQETIVIEDHYEPWDRWFENRIYPSKDGLSILFSEITERKRAEQLLLAELKVMELLSAGVSLEQALTAIVEKVEALSVDTIGSILLLDPDGVHVHHGAAPRLPEAYNRALEGAPIGPEEGSCGTAMYLRQQVIVTDIQTDPLWKNYRELAGMHGLRACWSTPVIGLDGKVLASFAMYYREPRSPQEKDFKLIERMTHLAQLAIERKRAERALRETQERLTRIVETIPEGLTIVNREGAITFANPPAERILGLSRADITQRSYNDPQWKITALDGSPFPDEDLPFARVKAGEGSVYDVEHAIVYPNGKRVALSINASPLRDAKGNFDGMVASITDITERKRAEETLRESEARFKAIASNTPDHILMQNRELKYTLVINPQLGLTEQDMLGKTDHYFLPKEEADRLTQVKTRVFETGEAVHFETTLISKSGQPEFFDGSYVPRLGAQGQVEGLIGYFRNVTERRRAEEQLRERERQLSTLIGNLPGAVYRCRNDANFTTEFISDGAAEMFGYPADDFREHRREVGQFIHPDDGERVAAEINAALKEDRAFQLTYRILSATGEQKWVWERGMGIKNAEGEVEVLEGFATDITERKRAEEALKRSENLYRTLAHNIPDSAVALFDKDLRFLLVDGKAVGVAGPPRELVEGRTIWEAFPQEVCQLIEPIYRSTLAGNETTLETPFGDRLFESQYVPIRDDDGNIFAGMVMSLDITERKRVEEALHTSEEKFSVIFKKAPFAAGLSSVSDGAYVEVNEEFERIFGFSREKIIGKTSLDLGMYPDLEMRKRAAELFRKQGYVHNLDLRLQSRTGEQHDVMINSDLVEIAGEKYILTTANDITERKRMEGEVIKARELFEKIFHYSPVAAALELLSGRIITDINSAFEELFGFTREELIGKSITGFDLWENDGERDKAFQSLMEKGSLRGFDWTFKTKSGSVGNGLIFADVIEQSGEKYLLIKIIDMTQRNLAEAALRESEERMRLFIDHAPAALAMFDREMRYLAVSKRWSADYQLTDGRIIGRSHYDIFPEISDEWKAIHRRGLRGEVIIAEEDMFIRADGSIQWLRWEVRPWYAADGSIGGIVIFSEDITERKKAQEELRSNERQLRENNISLIRLLTHRNLNVQERSESRHERERLRILYLENDPDDVVLFSETLNNGDISHDLTVSYDRMQYIRALENPEFDIIVLDFHLADINGTEALAMAQQVAPDIPVIVFTGSSTELDIALMMTSGAWNYVTKEQPSRLISAIKLAIERRRFIDEQFDTESALRSNQERFQSLIENSIDGIALFDGDGTILYGSPSTSSLIGYSLEEFEGRNILDFVHPEDRSLTSERLAEVVRQEGARVSLVMRFTHKNGEWRMLESVLTNLLALPTVGAIVCNYRDITDRKHAEEEIMHSKDQLRALSNHLQSAIEDERAHIAREIHDDLGQALTALKIDVSLCEKLALSEPSEATTSELEQGFATIKDLLTYTTKRLRNLITSLRPELLQELGVVAAIEWYISEIEKKSGLACTLNANISSAVDMDRGITVYRILQESLNNVIKHAEAHHVAIDLKEENAALTLTITDDGKGIQKSDMNKPQSFGLLSMKERAQQFGGVMEITRLEQGTQVRSRIPLEDAARVQ